MENTMFNLTTKSMNHFLGFFKVEEDKDDGVKQFCQSEYKKDWYAAYQHYKSEGEFPSYLRRTV